MIKNGSAWDYDDFFAVALDLPLIYADIFLCLVKWIQQDRLISILLLLSFFIKNVVAVAAYSRLASRSQAQFHTMKLSPLHSPCAAAPAQSTTSPNRYASIPLQAFQQRRVVQGQTNQDKSHEFWVLGTEVHGFYGGTAQLSRVGPP